MTIIKWWYSNQKWENWKHPNKIGVNRKLDVKIRFDRKYAKKIKRFKRWIISNISWLKLVLNKKQ